MEWFGVRCLFESAPSVYEERVTIWQAGSFEQAIELAETEANDYAATVESRYLGLAQGYCMGEEPEAGAEVFSLMRDSDLAPGEYLDAFFDTGSERQGHMD